MADKSGELRLQLLNVARTRLFNSLTKLIGTDEEHQEFVEELTTSIDAFIRAQIAGYHYQKSPYPDAQAMEQT